MSVQLFEDRRIIRQCRHTWWRTYNCSQFIFHQHLRPKLEKLYASSTSRHAAREERRTPRKFTSSAHFLRLAKTTRELSSARRLISRSLAAKPVINTLSFRGYVVTNFIRHLKNFRRSVLDCIEASDSESRIFCSWLFQPLANLYYENKQQQKTAKNHEWLIFSTEVALSAILRMVCVFLSCEWFARSQSGFLDSAGVDLTSIFLSILTPILTPHFPSDFWSPQTPYFPLTRFSIKKARCARSFEY